MTASTAMDVLKEAEESLRTLMKEAISSERYKEVASIASVAETIAKLRATLQIGNEKSIEMAGRQPSRATRRNAATRVTKSRKKLVTNRIPDLYPRFERDSDKLVKIGWSKKDRREYQHRVSLAVLADVGNALSNSVRRGEVFSMENMLPFKDSAGSEIPSYQAYLALAWFRSLGVVEQRGKEGYVVIAESLNPQRIQELWDSAPSRPTQPR